MNSKEGSYYEVPLDELKQKEEQLCLVQKEIKRLQDLKNQLQFEKDEQLKDVDSVQIEKRLQILRAEEKELLADVSLLDETKNQMLRDISQKNVHGADDLLH